MADLRSARSEAKGRKARLLPSAPPGPDATREEVATWLTVALGLGADPVERAERYGSHEEARMAVTLRSGRRITFERQADAFDAKRLVRVVVMATQVAVPPYQYAEGLQIATAIVQLAKTLADDDGRGEAAEWGRTFLASAMRNVVTVDELDSPVGRWAALSLITSWKPPADLPPYAPAAERAVLLIDSASGTRLVRPSDLGAHVRGILGRSLPWPALHGRMVEVGWEYRGEVQQRQPGGQGKAKARLYAVPSGWENE